MFEDKILMVDDEEAVLRGYARQFHGRLNLVTATGPVLALQILQEQGPFSVVISDMKMPKMNGVSFLSKVRESAPDAVRLLLTGQAGIDEAVSLINSGGVFRYLTKPCSPHMLASSISEALKEFHGRRSEKDLLENTLAGSIEVLSEVLSIASPVAFSRTARISRLMQSMVAELNLGDEWELEIAALLSQIGCIAVPEEILTRALRGESLSKEAKVIYRQHPHLAHKLLGSIPRLERVAQIIAYQNRSNRDLCEQRDQGLDQTVFWGAQTLKVAMAYDHLVHDKRAPVAKSIALISRRQKEGHYQGAAVRALKKGLAHQQDYKLTAVSIEELRVGMLLAEDLLSVKGHLLVGQGQEVTESVLARIHNISANTAIQQPIQVIEAAVEQKVS